MFFSQIEKIQIFGDQLVDEISLSVQTLNQLFAALLLTTLGVFFVANLLLLDPIVLAGSARITLACFSLLLIFYMISSQIGSLLWGMVLTYGLMYLLVYSHISWLVPVIHGVAVIAALYALRFLIFDHLFDFKLVFLMAAAATVTILGVDAYTSFDMLPRLHAGKVHQDTLFHASIASMIKNYGVSSTGLHGLVETPYHTLSHVLMAAVSLLSGLGVIEVYGVANWVLFSPLLIFSIATFCAMLDRSCRLALSLLWGVTSVLLTVMPFLFWRWAVWNSFFISESYLVSLGLFLLGYGLLYKRCLSIGDLLLIFLLTALISNAKASVGMIFSWIWLTRLFFIRGGDVKRNLIALILSVTAAYGFVFDSAQAESEVISFAPFHLIRTLSFLGHYLGNVLAVGTDAAITTILLAAVSVVSFFIIHFLLSWVVIGIIGYRSGVDAILKAPLSIYSLSVLLVGVLLISAIDVGGSAVFYFSNVAFFVSLPGIVAISTGWMKRYEMNPQTFLIIGVILICVLSVKGFYKKSFLYQKYSAHVKNTMIDHMIELRNTSSRHIVLKANADVLAQNPVERCSAKPFVFPAASERPWTNVISPSCSYKDYGYRQYGLSETQRNITVPPVLPIGMTVRNYIR